LCAHLQIAHSTLVHANDLEELVEDDVSDVNEHLLHQLGVGGRRLVLVDLVLGLAVLILELGRDEVVGIVHTLLVLFICCPVIICCPLIFPLIVWEIFGEAARLDLLLEEVKLVEENDEGLSLEVDVVDDGGEEVQALVHPVRLIVLVQEL